MTTIVAGQYETFDAAKVASERLSAARFDAASISVFFNNAPGRHATFPTGGDEFADPEARVMDEGAGKGAAVGAGVGLAAAAAGPLGAVAAGVGAYVGGLAGAASESEKHEDEPQKLWRRPAAVMVAVAVPDAPREEQALRVLRETGAENIERAEGEISDGNWVDFDPIAVPQLGSRRAPVARCGHGVARAGRA
jgi:hypothetical protein